MSDINLSGLNDVLLLLAGLCAMVVAAIPLALWRALRIRAARLPAAALVLAAAFAAAQLILDGNPDRQEKLFYAALAVLAVAWIALGRATGLRAWAIDSLMVLLAGGLGLLALFTLA